MKITGLPAVARRAEAGLTLIEVAILMVATSAIIGALAPSLATVVRNAETAAATTAMTTLRNQILQMIVTDLGPVGYTRFTVNGGTTATTGTTAVNLLVSDGDIPRECSAVASACTSWQAVVDSTTGLVDFLERHLVTNNPRGSAANDYPDDEFNATFPDSYWQGTYLSAPIDPDPWGNRYMVNVQFLGGTSTNEVIVLSAGPDEEIDSAYAADSITAGDDDLKVQVEP